MYKYFYKIIFLFIKNHIIKNTLSPTNAKNTTNTNNKTEKNFYSIENMYISNNNTKDYFSWNNSPAGYASPSNCDNFNKRNLW